MSIETLLSSADGSDRTVDLREGRIGQIRDDELLWVDVSGDDEAELQIVCDALALEGDVAEALGRDLADHPDAMVLDEGVELTLFWFDEGEEEPVPVQVLAGSGWVITRHERALERLDQQREKITDQREIGLLRPVEFVAAILGWHLDAFFRTVANFERDVDRLDTDALRSDRDLLDKLVAMRQRIARTRRVAAAHAGVYAEIARPDFLPELDDADAALLIQLSERLERATAAIASVREMLIGTFDVYMTRVAQRTNDVMRVLTWVSVLLLPAVVIAGVMGMNFKVGFFDNPSYFFVVIGLMVLLALTTLVAARWRGWL